MSKTLIALDGAKVSTKTVFVSKDRKLDKFAGHPKSEKDPAVEEWLEDAEYHMKMMGEDEKVHFLLDHITVRQKMKCGFKMHQTRTRQVKLYTS